MKRKTYKSRRLVLRPFRVSDYLSWKVAYESCGPRQNKWEEYLPKSLTRREFQKLINKQKRKEKTDRSFSWNIFLKRSGEFVGNVGIAPIQRRILSKANLGYFILENRRKNGYAKEAIRCLVPKAFKDLELHRFEASIDPDNKGSLRLAASAGLYREGIRKHYYKQNGRWEDQVVFAAVPELFR